MVAWSKMPNVAAPKNWTEMWISFRLPNVPATRRLQRRAPGSQLPYLIYDLYLFRFLNKVRVRRS
jgi:hypothetical protein